MAQNEIDAEEDNSKDKIISPDMDLGFRITGIIFGIIAGVCSLIYENQKVALTMITYAYLFFVCLIIFFNFITKRHSFI